MADFKKYLELIQFNLTEQDKPNLQLLKQVISAHLSAFPYQNTDLFIEGRKPIQERVICPIDLDSIFDQMVIHQRPGYCFQNAELLAWALATLGFSVGKHLAKVVNCFSQNIREDLFADDIVSHELLIIDLSADDGLWVIDTGFANNSLREPLAMRFGEHEIATEQYRLSGLSQQNIIRLEIKMHQGWFCLYDFDRQAKSQADIDEANRQLFINPKAPLIRNFLKLGHVNHEKRKNLVRFPAGGASFFKSLSSTEKHYDLVALSEDAQLTRHAFAVKVTEENALKYSVLDPFCPKTAKSTITGIITANDLQKIIGTEQVGVLFRKLQDDKIGAEPLQSLKPFLSTILAITAERGHTHGREKTITSVAEYCELAKEKFHIALDEAALSALTL